MATSLESEPVVYYVIRDDEGIWMTQEPVEASEILFSSTDLSKAEDRMCREINLCGD